MSESTGIAWTDHTFNPWWGCVRVSPGCEHCYAETWDTRWKGGHWGVQAPRRFFGDAHWNEPRKWDKAAAKAGQRARVFCASMADVFEDRRDLDEQRQRLWHLILDTPNLDWQLLTKRPENLGKFLPPDWLDQPRLNVWLGTTVEDQKRANERIPHLLRTPAAVRFLSCEPLLGLVYLWETRGLDWLIIGGESGAGARPMNLSWARSLMQQAAQDRISVFVKQLGGAHDKQDDPRAWPDDLRIREFPEGAA
jgi:protein gp37